MKPSSLRPIILRLEAMIEDKSGEVQVRRFETNGELRATVKYLQDREVFIVNDPSDDEDMEFDDIDFVAIEILELVQPVLSSEESN